MSDMRELYQEIILDHNKKPRNCYVMDCATRSADGHNPLCGDFVKVYLRIEDGIIEEFKRRFMERYEGRPVPLLEALDEETGIGVEGQGHVIDHPAHLARVDIVPL